MKKNKFFALALASVMSTTTLSGCGNQDMWDSVKSYNLAIESTDDTVSMFIITEYDDYTGEMVQLYTQDGLVVLTSTKDTDLLRMSSKEAAFNYINAYADVSEKEVISYDELCGLPQVIETSYNKSWLDTNYTYTKAIIKTDTGVIVADVKQWRTWDEDDKIQIIFTDDNVVLRDITGVKLVNDENASPDSFHNYVLTLVGDEEKITYYSSEKAVTKELK